VFLLSGLVDVHLHINRPAQASRGRLGIPSGRSWLYPNV